jgi:hypothetical protein
VKYLIHFNIHTESLHEVNIQQIVQYILGEDVTVVNHEIKCHNCENLIYGFCYNCDQMAAQVREAKGEKREIINTT